MKKTSKIIIDEKHPFINCKLDREVIADNLTRIIEGIEGDFVLGLDSPWGTGKSTFIEMWVQKLKNEKSDKIFPIYFNAWENDFHGEALLSIVGELDKHLKNNKNVKNDDYLKVVGNIAGNITKLITGGIVDPMKLKDDLNSTGKRTLFDGYQLYETLKNEIKDDLKRLKTNLNVQKIIFFIDELDRCRPDYAVQTLEKIKHFFNVDDYVFVLALDKKQLSHSVATIYGVGMDSEGYLKRFIDLDYSLPNPSKEKYLDYLIKTHKLNEKNKIFMEIIRNFAKESDVSLRDLEKLFYKIKLVLPLSKLSYPEVGTDDMCFTIDILSLMYGYFICLNLKYKDSYDEIINEKRNMMKDYENFMGSEIHSIKLADKELPVSMRNLVKSFKWLDIYNYLYNGKILLEDNIKVLKEISSICSGKKEYTNVIFKIGNNVQMRSLNFNINQLFKENKFIIKEHIEFVGEFNME